MARVGCATCNHQPERLPTTGLAWPSSSENCSSSWKSQAAYQVFMAQGGAHSFCLDFISNCAGPTSRFGHYLSAQKALSVPQFSRLPLMLQLQQAGRNVRHSLMGANCGLVLGVASLIKHAWNKQDF